MRWNVSIANFDCTLHTHLCRGMEAIFPGYVSEGVQNSSISEGMWQRVNFFSRALCAYKSVHYFYLLKDLYVFCFVTCSCTTLRQRN